MNGKTFQMPIPEGYCRPSAISPAVSDDVTNERGDVLAYAAYLERCDAMRAGTGDQQFLVIKYFKNRKLNTDSRSAFVELNAPKVNSAEFMRWLESEEVADRVEQRTAGRTGAALNLTARPQPLGHDDVCIYTGSEVEIAIADRSKTAMLIAMCTTKIDQNLVTIHASSRSESDAGFADLVRTLKTTVNSITAE